MDRTLFPCRHEPYMAIADKEKKNAMKKFDEV